MTGPLRLSSKLVDVMRSVGVDAAAATCPAFRSAPMAWPLSAGPPACTAWRTVTNRFPPVRFSTADSGFASGQGFPPFLRTAVPPGPGRWGVDLMRCSRYALKQLPARTA